ncbi:hypothetical protein TYRP_011623 [Tyrophagus putrescentiae]|nr:hypothetical protein TYRP_011623 [Tyrophagus putrescentiae]
MNENDENENPVVYLSRSFLKLTMFSVSELLALKEGTSVVNSMVDSFFEEKKILVKERLMESVKVIVDGLFDEMVGQVKEMMMPPKESASNDQVKHFGFGKTTSTLVKPPTKSPMKTQTVSPSQPPKNKLIFATKSKPGPSTSAAAQPFSGLYKRMAEEDGFYTSSSNSQPNKKKAVTEDDVAFSTSDEVLVVIPIEQALMESGMNSSTFGAGGGGGDVEQLDKDTAQKNTAISSDPKPQPKQTAEKKVACPEPECGKLIASHNLKQHLRIHAKVKQFGCTFPGCSKEFSQRHNAIRHILSVHLKKQKPEVNGNEDSNEPPDPVTYLSYFLSLLITMFSLGNHLSLNNPSMVHSLVDSFFEGKKALVKERLMDSVRVIVDGLFEEMVGQVKEMLLPPKSAVNDQVKTYAASTLTPVKPPTTKSPMNISTVPPSQPPKNKLIFATKSKPGPSTSAVAQPFSGLYKRMAEADGFYTSSSNSQPNKKKAVTEDDVAISTSDEVLVVIPIEQALMESGMNSSTFGAGGGGGDVEQLDKDTAHENIASNSKQQPKQTAEKKVACPEPGCGKLMISFNLKRHLRTHTKTKPYGCTFPGCSMEFSHRQSALRHIRNVHLKKEKKGKPGEDAEEEDGNGEQADPAAYLSVKEELF